MGNDNKQKQSGSVQLRQRAEEQLDADTPEGGLSRTDTETSRLFHELEVHQLELEMQNNELVQSRDEATKGLKRFADLYDFAPVGYMSLDRSGAISSVNFCAAGYLGSERLHLIGKRFLLYVAEDCRNAFSFLLGEVWSSQARINCETVLIRTDGAPIITTVIAVTSASGQECVLVLIDITEKREMEKKLHDRERRLDFLLKSTPAVIYTCRPFGDFGATFVSDNVQELFGYTASQFLEDSSFWVNHIHPDDVESAIAGFNDLVPHRVRINEYRFRHQDGSYRWTHEEVRLLTDEKGAFSELIGYWVDVTERKSKDILLLQSEERYRCVVENQTEVISRFTAEGVYTFVNDVYCRFFDKTREELLGSNWHPVVFPEDLPLVEDSLSRMSPSHPVVVIENRIKTNTGEVRWMQFVNSGFFDSDGRLLEIQSVGRDITPQRQVEESLKKSEETLAGMNNKLRDLNNHLQTVQEQERMAIARDIHDDIGQNLTVLKLDLEWLGNRLSADNGELHERMIEMRTSIDSITAIIQRIAADLRPPLLDNLGLTAAIGWHVDEFCRRSGLECFLMLNDDADLDDVALSTAVMRIVQEGLTNVVRHAQATEVTVSLCKREENLILEIADNGCGIAPDQLGSPKAYGLMGMQERARICGGNLEISRNHDAGTTLQLTVPLRRGECSL